MVNSKAVYHEIVSGLTTRVEGVLDLCEHGHIAEARLLLIESDEPEMLLARGVVYYWLARTQTEFSHEEAKDILTKAERLFAEKGDNNRVAHCRVFLGLCYWRQGYIPEALILFGQAALADHPHVRFLALLNTSVLQTEKGCWREALRTLDELQPLLDLESNLSLKGKFYHQRGWAHCLSFDATKDQAEFDQGLVDYEAALFHYEQANNTRYEASVRANIAFRLRNHDPQRAHENLNKAIVIYERLGDRTLLAQAKDTKAQILLTQGRLRLAQKYIDQGIQFLRMMDDRAWLPVLLITRGRVRARRGFHVQALEDFELSAELAQDNESKGKALLAAISELRQWLGFNDLVNLFRRAVEVDPSEQGDLAMVILERVKAESLLDLQQSKNSREREIIRKALKQSEGSVTRAAKILGWTHAGLIYVLRTRHPDLQRKPKQIRKK